MAAGTKPPQPPVRYCPHSAGGGAELVEASEQELQEEEPLGESAVLAAPQLAPGTHGARAALPTLEDRLLLRRPGPTRPGPVVLPPACANFAPSPRQVEVDEERLVSARVEGVASVY